MNSFAFSADNDLDIVDEFMHAMQFEKIYEIEKNEIIEEAAKAGQLIVREFTRSDFTKNQEQELNKYYEEYLQTTIQLFDNKEEVMLGFRDSVTERFTKEEMTELVSMLDNHLGKKLFLQNYLILAEYSDNLVMQFEQPVRDLITKFREQAREVLYKNDKF